MHISRVIDENVRKIAKNGDLKTRIYASKNISSCRAYNSEYSGVFRLVLLSILPTKTTAAQNDDALSYYTVRGLYFLAVVFVRIVYISKY